MFGRLGVRGRELLYVEYFYVLDFVLGVGKVIVVEILVEDVILVEKGYLEVGV